MFLRRLRLRPGSENILHGKTEDFSVPRRRTGTASLQFNSTRGRLHWQTRSPVRKSPSSALVQFSLRNVLVEILVDYVTRMQV